ncbi:MAG: hypothetical protein ACKO3W_07980 [bacterium]
MQADIDCHAAFQCFDAILPDAAWPGRDRLRQRFRCDRRESPRWPVLGNATILTLGAELGTVVELTRLDGSPWWLGGDATTPLAVGTKVSVGFSHPGGRPARGVIARCEGFGEGRFRMAVRFEDDGVV